MKITLEEFEKIEQGWEGLNPKQEGTAVLIRARDNGGLNQAVE